MQFVDQDTRNDLLRGTFVIADSESQWASSVSSSVAETDSWGANVLTWDNGWPEVFYL